MMYDSQIPETEFDVERTDASANTFLRLRPKGNPRLGWCEIDVVRPGFTATVTDVIRPDVVDRYYGFRDDTFKVHMRLHGGARIGGDHGNDAELSDDTWIMLFQPKSGQKRETIFADRERSITLACSRDFMHEVARHSNIAIPEVIRSFVDGGTPPYTLRMIAPTLSMRRVAEGMLDSSPLANFRRIMREAKALELLCMTLERLGDPPDGRKPLRQRDRTRVDDVRAILQNDGGTKYSIAELCKAVAWNETQMMECFKQMTGVTISDYRNRLIMERAYARLSNSEVTVTEVAFDSGYGHPSNFATAFKRAFGISPREVRSGITPN